MARRMGSYGERKEGKKRGNREYIRGRERGRMELRKNWIVELFSNYYC